MAWWQLVRSTPGLVTALATGLVAGLVTGLSIEIALVVVAAVSNAVGVQWFAVPTVGMAALTGLKIAPIGGLAAGLLGGMAVIAVARGDQRQAHRSPRARRARAGGIIIAGLMVGVAALPWFQRWLAVGLGIIAAILATVSGRYVHRFRTSTDLRHASAAGIVAGAVAYSTFTPAAQAALAFGLGMAMAAGLTIGAGFGLVVVTRSLL